MLFDGSTTRAARQSLNGTIIEFGKLSLFGFCDMSPTCGPLTPAGPGNSPISAGIPVKAIRISLGFSLLFDSLMLR